MTNSIINHISQINQGDIIMIDFSPTVGHEQAGHRPAIVVSNNSYMKLNQLVIVLPISTAVDNFPPHINLETVNGKVNGKVLTEHIRTMDPYARTAKIVDHATKNVINRCKDLINRSVF